MTIGVEEDEISFFDAFFKCDVSEYKKWLLNLRFRSSDTVKMRFDLLIMVFSLFNCFFVPVKVAFEPK